MQFIWGFFTCPDSNPCALGTDNCSPLATCTHVFATPRPIDIYANFMCACNDGYTGLVSVRGEWIVDSLRQRHELRSLLPAWHVRSCARRVRRPKHMCLQDGILHQQLLAAVSVPQPHAVCGVSSRPHVTAISRRACNETSCGVCLHNTTGPNCGTCRDGFFGNATRGTPGDCITCNITCNGHSQTCYPSLEAAHGDRLFNAGRVVGADARSHLLWMRPAEQLVRGLLRQVPPNVLQPARCQYRLARLRAMPVQRFAATLNRRSTHPVQDKAACATR